MEMAQDQSRIVELGRQIDAHEHVVREEPVGWDRHWNRYWILGSCSGDHPGAFWHLSLNVHDRIVRGPGSVGHHSV